MQPLLQWKSNKYYIFSVCVYSLRYTDSNAHAQYCHLKPIWVYNIFQHHLINSMIFGGQKIIEHKMFFYFLYNFDLIFFHSKQK